MDTIQIIHRHVSYPKPLQGTWFLRSRILNSTIRLQHPLSASWTSRSRFSQFINDSRTNGSRFRLVGHKAIDQICEYYATLQDRPVISRVEPGYLRKALPCRPFCRSSSDPCSVNGSAEAPETGEDFESVMQDFQSYIMPGTSQGS